MFSEFKPNTIIKPEFVYTRKMGWNACLSNDPHLKQLMHMYGEKDIASSCNHDLLILDTFTHSTKDSNSMCSLLNTSQCIF